MVPIDNLMVYSLLITLNLLNISLIYPTKLRLNKTITFDQETSFLDLDMKIIISNIHTSVYDKRGEFRFPVVRAIL